MARYSLARRDRKIAGVASTLGDVLNIDPTVVRIGYVALALLVSWQLALIAYFGAAIWLAVQKNKAGKRTGRKRSEFDRMGDLGHGKRASVHALRTELTATDRRMMAIDHHLSANNDALAREIEALREEK